ncbi:hypothetical protein QO179_24375 [Bacillus stercoris]|nr:hypothetical protein [Bacillus stercoris]
MTNKVKIEITEEEWIELSPEKRNKIVQLMKKYGYDSRALEALEKEYAEDDIQDIFNQFYGDEE